MIVTSNFKVWFSILIGFCYTEKPEVSYNQPKLSLCSLWDSKGITFLDKTVIGNKPLGIFINRNNTLFVAENSTGRVREWRENSTSPTRTSFSGLFEPWGLFVTIEGDIYVDNGGRGKIEKWATNAATSTVVMNVSNYCSGLFVDIANFIYCSLEADHKVIKKSLDAGASAADMIAGTGTLGSTSNALKKPYGIFVDTNFSLYVADCGNNRVQLFKQAERNGITVAGQSVAPSFPLKCPASILLDEDGYLFIVDNENHRIVRSTPDGFLCLVGCSKISGLTDDRLYHPLAAAFDTYGNIFVADQDNNRIQKFVLLKNACDNPTTTHQITFKITTKTTTAEYLQLTSETTQKKSITSDVNDLQQDKTTISEPITSSLYKIQSDKTTPLQSITSNLYDIQQSETTLSESVTSNLNDIHKDKTTWSESATSTEFHISSASLLSTSSFHRILTTSMTTELTLTQLTASATSFPNQMHSTTENVASEITPVRQVSFSEETSSQSSPSTELLRDQNCSSPVISLIPQSLSGSTPITFERSEDFYIVSEIKFHCNISFPIKTQWSITNYTVAGSFPIPSEQFIKILSNEIFIPAKSLIYGVYEFKLTITIDELINSTVSKVTYIKIIPSDIIVNLVPFGASMITLGHQQNLTLNPGLYSINPDLITFNLNDWDYLYYYQMYNHTSFSSTLIDTSSNEMYTNIQVNNKTSSLIMSSELFVSNQIYQIKVTVFNQQDSSRQFNGYLLVKIENTNVPMIFLTCVITSMCIPKNRFQYINPTTQVSLQSECVGDCSLITKIEWNVYRGLINETEKYVEWIPFNRVLSEDDVWFSGLNTPKFTISETIFSDKWKTDYWRFDTVYSFSSGMSSCSLYFQINHSPESGHCTISPNSGTSSTLFNLSCFNWTDIDGIKDYSIYVSTRNSSEKMFLGFYYQPYMQLFLPAGDEITSELQITVHIRDKYYSVKQYQMQPIIVVSDSTNMNILRDVLEKPTNHPLLQLISHGSQNQVGQIITSISKDLNQINIENIQTVVLNGIPAMNIAISPLDGEKLPISSALMNDSHFNQYKKQLNTDANILEYLVTAMINLPVTTADSIKLQASSLSQLTETTNHLTRLAASQASGKCHQLAISLGEFATKISYEDFRMTATYIAQCASNTLTAINIPLQQRGIILDLDLNRANTLPDTDLEYELLANEESLSRNDFYQKQAANRIFTEVDEIISLITTASNNYLNINKKMLMNTSTLFFSLESLSFESLSNKTIKPINRALIRIPSNLSRNTPVLIRSMMRPLPPANNFNSHTNINLSMSISLSILNLNGTEIPISTNMDHPIEFIIPRDINLIIPSMIEQNVTFTANAGNLLFHLHAVDITQLNRNLTVSLHLEIRPLNISLAYLLIYKFDNAPELTFSKSNIDGWSLLCPINLTSDNIYNHYIDNQRTANRRWVVYGIRELNFIEYEQFCSNISNITIDPPLTNLPFQFSSNYELRTYLSGCYYLDSKHNWQSDGLLVGPLTNHYQTQCFSTHLTTFTSGFSIVPIISNWNHISIIHDYLNQNNSIQDDIQTSFHRAIIQCFKKQNIGHICFGITDSYFSFNNMLK